MNKKQNRLIKEQSPYLLQHAYNPVDWFSWSDEAFEKSKKENKPIFLSIGYSTCHWCHVMERESFEDIDVAKLLNENFISIKVDREERPDIDNIYMQFCQITTGSGGWPLTVILTPDKKPFFAGTYFPKYSVHGRIGIMELLPRINQTWKDKRSEVETSVNQIVEYLKRDIEPSLQPIDDSVIEKAFNQLSNNFDNEFGGFGIKPKFPTPHNFLFLLRYCKKTKNNKALEIVLKSLHKIKYGGICDHIGFGFHRYSTDKEWLVPHFEKMLYDQAMLAMAYIETYQFTNNKFFLDSAEEIFKYVLRDMTDSSGGFYTAEDADSENVEGKFYIWELEEIKSLLGDDEKIISTIYNLREEGNFNIEGTNRKSGKNIFNLKESIDKLAIKLNLSIDDLKIKLESIRQKLFIEREKRIHPLKDDKILTSWNGLMIAALAKGCLLYNETSYLEAAKKSANFILQKLFINGKLLHRYRNGYAGIDGNLDDYSFFIWGLLELYESSLDEEYLMQAIELNNSVISTFWDEENSGFYFTSAENKDVIARQKEIYDGAIPSSNSIQLQNLIWIYKITSDEKLKIKIDLMLKTFTKNINNSPQSFTHFISSYYLLIQKSTEIIIVNNENTAEVTNIIKAIKKEFLPNKIILFKNLKNQNLISKMSPFTENYKTINNKLTIYVCEDYKCNPPTNDLSKAFQYLKN
ncbi:MAG: thioredoxin domain-containing protein [Bacteroidetes bacterium]|nr:thioredoxin domain-containing protein [Bacteroidota bacterium]